MAAPEIRHAPDAPTGEIISADVVCTDGVVFVKQPNGGWLPAGIGFVGMLLEPISQGEMIVKITNAASVSWIPDMNVDLVVKGRGF